MTARAPAEDIHSLLKFAHELADLSGPAVLKHFRKPVSIDNKAAAGAFDPVTKADRAAERVISSTLKSRYPHHGIIGEEYGTRAGSGRFSWVVDPIDGTRAYIMGSPMWGTLIGLLDDGKPCLGIMDQPFTRERFWCGGKASYTRIGDGPAKKIKTRACARLEDATLTSTHPDLFEAPGTKKAFDRLKAVARMTRFGGDCYHYSLLASGFVDLVIETNLKTYDIAALIPIIEKAGGIVTTWDGGVATNGGDVIASGDPSIHEAAIKLLAGR